MKRRMIIMLAAVFVFIGGIAFVKYRQIQTAMAQGAAYQPPPEAVTTITAGRDQWPEALNSIGSAEAVHGVVVSADLPGIVEKIAFESGRSVREGDLLLSLDTRQEQAQLAAAEAQRDLARTTFQRIQELFEKGVTSRQEFDSSGAELKQAEARVGEIQATIERKTIRAPFSGILGIRQVNLGQYLNAGDPVVPLQSLDPIYVNFSVPQQQVNALKVGGEVEVKADGGASTAGSSAGQAAAGAAGAAANAPATNTLNGTITAINSVVDEATRNVQVQATFRNPEGRMRPGMFVEARVVLGPGMPIVALPASAISYAPYGNSIFIVDDIQGQNGMTYKGVRQQFVKLGASRGDQIAILSGVEPGQEVVTSGVFKLRNGAAVQVNNEVQPSNNPAPLPEDS